MLRVIHVFIELTVLPGWPRDPGAPLKPSSPFGLSKGEIPLSEKVKQKNKSQRGEFFLPDLLHYPEPPVTHPNH